MTETPPGVDLDRLRPWFAAHVAGASGAALDASLISGGRSNLTYAIGDGAHTWVLRRPPLGHVLPTAHDMAREYKVLAALAGTPVPVPRTLAFCDDDSVNDAPFYVMEMVDGVILRTGADLAGLTTDDARRCSEELVDVLVAIHAVDYHAVGLDDFGHPDGYVERQVRRWGEQWERSKTRELPSIDELARRLRAALPASPPPTIVHGDYRLDNTMLDRDDPGRIVAVLDWEMATLGDPLADLGLFLLYWARDDTQAGAAGATISPDAGFLTRDEVVARYARRSDRDVSELDFYEALAAYKLAIILEGINARFLMGKTVGDGFEHMGALVEVMVQGALDQCSRSSIPALRGGR
ncbi:MAG TPA: phosphotransferase family protein [Acidimicrobiia bacterium]|nr:phosphotransferase family protein [Acidimicrobiia bacterium]